MKIEYMLDTNYLKQYKEKNIHLTKENKNKYQGKWIKSVNYYKHKIEKIILKEKMYI